MDKFYLHKEEFSLFDLRKKANKSSKALDRMYLKNSKTLLAYTLVNGRTIYYSIVPKTYYKRLKAISCVHSYAKWMNQKQSKLSCGSCSAA